MSESSTITVIESDDLGRIDIPVSGLVAHQAFSTTRAAVCRLSIPPDADGWLRHPDRELYGYVRQGQVAVGVQDAARLTAESGDCLRVPAGADYQLAAAGSESAVVLAALVGTGPLFESVGAPSTHPHPPAHSPAHPRPESAESRTVVAHPEEFVPTAQLANLTRMTPFPDAPVQQVVGHAEGELASDWHHHGDNDVFGYVIEGAGFVDDGSAEPPLATAGSWFHVPAGVVHRDVNPDPAPQEYVLWLTGSEPRIVHVEGPE